MRRLLLVISAIVVLFTCCKKTSDDKVNQFNFEFNGTKYKQLTNAGLLIFGGELDVIFIERPELFGGTIFYHTNSSISNNCAYLYPTGEHFLLKQPGCIIDNGGNPIDSAKVYLYRSGHLNYSKINCRHKKEPAPSGGGTIEYDECDVTGTFNLTLVNKNNQTIVISKGSFFYYDQKF